MAALPCVTARAQTVSNVLRETTLMVSPVFGWDRNELREHGPRGVTTSHTDTAPEYGVFLLLSHPNFALNDFLFFSRVNDADIAGNLLFANCYGPRSAKVTWNVGGGYLYHRIRPDGEDIRIDVPMAKAGPLLRITALGLTLNPYLGYSWEAIDTRHGNEDNEYYLYGLSASWRWRMLAASANYYYQDRRDGGKDYQTLHCRMIVLLSQHWSLGTRLDYMEHPSTRDTSILAGPSYIF